MVWGSLASFHCTKGLFVIGHDREHCCLVDKTKYFLSRVEIHNSSAVNIHIIKKSVLNFSFI